ncbi:hypothetical protein FO519_009631, partial [Halicephalobus sp. NKZ332]
STTGTCPDGSITVPDSLGSKWKCFELFVPGEPFFVANHNCSTKYKGYLVSVPNGFINFLIAQTVGSLNQTSSRFWIGANNLSGAGWKNIDDNSNVTYFDWASGEPGNLTESNGCVSVDLHGLWYNDDCFANYSFVCEIPEDSTPSVCGSYVPISIDATAVVTLHQLNAVKNFLVQDFLYQTLPSHLQPATRVSCCSDPWYYWTLPNTIDELVYQIETITYNEFNDSHFYDALNGLCSLGIFDHKEGIPINAIIFTGVELPHGLDDLIQMMIDECLANGTNTITAVMMNPGIEVSYQNLSRLEIIQWSDPAILYSNIRQKMKCSSAQPVYRPCKSWVSFALDYSNVLSNESFQNMELFVVISIMYFNHPERVQLININDNFISKNYNWNHAYNNQALTGDITSRNRNLTIGFNLATTLNKIGSSYFSTSINKPIKDPVRAIVFISDTSNPENYEGAGDAAEYLKSLGYRLFFVLMGPDVDESKLTNYTTDFIYWRNMSNPQPENWDQVRLQAYGCDQTTEF